MIKFYLFIYFLSLVIASSNKLVDTIFILVNNFEANKLFTIKLGESYTKRIKLNFVKRRIILDDTLHIGIDVFKHIYKQVKFCVKKSDFI